MRVTIVAFCLVLGTAMAAAAQTVSEGDTSTQSGLLPEPAIMKSAVALAGQWMGESGPVHRDGFYPDFRNMVTGAGWISAGPGYRTHLFDGRGFVDGSAAISWRAYKMAQARFEVTDLAAHHLTVGSQIRWQDLTQVNYFGTGENSVEGSHSQYRLKDTDVVGYAVYQVNRWLGVRGTFGWLQQPTLSSPTGPFQGNYPDARLTFSQDPGMASQPSFLHGSASVVVDSRDYPGHPTRGAMYRGGFAAYSDRDGGPFTFRSYDAEGLQLVPLKNDTWILALHGWGVFSETSSGDVVPFYFLPSLGGENTLRGYDNYRFHDRNMLLASAESRWALFRDVDAVAFFDSGNVAPRAGDLNLKKTSWGGGVRVHTRTSTVARLDVGHSREGWQVLFKIDDPFRVNRASRRTADAPFVP